MWPEPTLLRDKLYGNLEELRRTAAFVRATGIFIYRTTPKKKSPYTDTRPNQPKHRPGKGSHWCTVTGMNSSGKNGDRSPFFRLSRRTLDH